MTKHSGVVRGAVLLSSAGVAALLVSQAGVGCDRPQEPAKVEPAKVEPAKVEPSKAEPAKAEPKVEPVITTPVKVETKTEPVAAPPEPGPAKKNDAPKSPPANGLNNAEPAPHYFPASKAGVFIEHTPPPQPQPQQAPQAGGT